MQNFGRITLAFLFFTSLICASSLPVDAGTICKLNCVKGFEWFCNASARYVGSSTSSIDRIKIYIDKTADNVFSFGSNYLGSRAEYPTKIIGFEEAKDIESVFLNLDESVAAKLNASRSETLNRFYDSVEIYISANAFNSDGSLPVNLRGAKKVFVLDPESGEAIRTDRLSTAPPPPVWVSTLSGCCLKGRPPSTVRGVAAYLTKMPFRKRDTKILSLISDMETEAALAKGNVSKRLLASDPLKLTEKAIENVLEQHAGGTLIV